MAAEGSAAYDGKTYFRIPAFATNAIDPTGAGDTYAAGFAVGHMTMSSLRDACSYASCVASIMVENVGPEFPLTAQEVERRLKILLK
jgi:sugar/nucleoside kinase (ribokinase family)